MNRMLPVLPVLLCSLLAGCLPRDNPFDGSDVEGRYQPHVTSNGTSVTVRFTALTGHNLRGHRVYREDARGSRVLVAEVPVPQEEAVDDGAAAAAAAAQSSLEDGTLWWRVAGFTDAGEGPLSTRTDGASTHALPDTRVDPLPDYITGVAGVAVLVRVIPPASGEVSAHHFRYRFKGQDWTEPLAVGPLVLTGLEDGRYTLELVAEAENGDRDLTPATTSFTYDFYVPEGTTCGTAVCNAGLVCVQEPVGSFCRQLCLPESDLDGGSAGCPVGTQCRPGTGPQGEPACVVTAAPNEGCVDRLCAPGLTCVDTEDARKLCGPPCGPSDVCTDGQQCVGQEGKACLTAVEPGEECSLASCPAGFACEQLEDHPRCRRICGSQASCNVGELCQALGRGELRICR